MADFKRYLRKGKVDARPYEPGEDMNGVSVSSEDRAMGSPRKGDMICRSRTNHRDQWLVNEAVFEVTYEEESRDG